MLWESKYWVSLGPRRAQPSSAHAHHSQRGPSPFWTECYPAQHQVSSKPAPQLWRIKQPRDAGETQGCLLSIQYLSASNLPFSALLGHTGPAAAAKSLQLCPTVCNPIDGSPSGSPVPGILQARILEWVAISFSNAWKWKVKVRSLSRFRLLATLWTTRLLRPWDFPGKSTGVGCH